MVRSVFNLLSLTNLSNFLVDDSCCNFPGKVLPAKSLLVVSLVPGEGDVPGYAVVSFQQRHDCFGSNTLYFILPFYELWDEQSRLVEGDGSLQSSVPPAGTSHLVPSGSFRLCRRR